MLPRCRYDGMPGRWLFFFIPLDGAAQAVQDTFIIAASRLQGLRDPERLSAWLYAVARNECLRQLVAGGSQGAARVSARADPSDAPPAVELALDDLLTEVVRVLVLV